MREPQFFRVRSGKILFKFRPNNIPFALHRSWDFIFLQNTTPERGGLAWCIPRSRVPKDWEFGSDGEKQVPLAEIQDFAKPLEAGT